MSLVPVQKMTAQDLCSMTQEVIKTVTAAGYNIVAILSDNNVINRKMFMELSGTKTLVPFILNPVNKIDRIYLLFDTVHLLKCIRNNWINEADKTFVYPSFTDSTSVMHASFSNLIELYHIEKANVLKDGYLLNWKALFPNAIETYFTRLLRALMCFSNICLNNYSKNMSDSTSSSKKQSQKKTAKLN